MRQLLCMPPKCSTGDPDYGVASECMGGGPALSMYQRMHSRQLAPPQRRRPGSPRGAAHSPARPCSRKSIILCSPGLPSICRSIPVFKCYGRCYNLFNTQELRALYLGMRRLPAAADGATLSEPPLDMSTPS